MSDIRYQNCSMYQNTLGGILSIGLQLRSVEEVGAIVLHCKSGPTYRRSLWAFTKSEATHTASVGPCRVFPVHRVSTTRSLSTGERTGADRLNWKLRRSSDMDTWVYAQDFSPHTITTSLPVGRDGDTHRSAISEPPLIGEFKFSRSRGYLPVIPRLTSRAWMSCVPDQSALCPA
jgi:hypothetical protein